MRHSDRPLSDGRDAGDKGAAGSVAGLDPYFFASPHPSTQDYALNYQATVAAYTVANYAADIVPILPAQPPFHALNAGGPTHDVHVIPLGAPNAPDFSLVNNHSPVAYARMLDPGNAVAWSLPLP